MSEQFKKIKAIFHSKDQAQLETAMWGMPIPDQNTRRKTKEKAEHQIAWAEYEFPNPIPYRAMAQLQLGVLQMGLMEDYAESGYSILKGISESWQGDEYDVANISAMGFSILTYWTDKADRDSRFRCNLMINWLIENELVPCNESSKGPKKNLLGFSFACASVLSTVWRYGTDIAPGEGLSRQSQIYKKSLERAEQIEDYFDYQIPVQKWMNQRIKLY